MTELRPGFAMDWVDGIWFSKVDRTGRPIITLVAHERYL